MLMTGIGSARASLPCLLCVSFAEALACRLAFEPVFDAAFALPLFELLLELTFEVADFEGDFFATFASADGENARLKPRNVAASSRIDRARECRRFDGFIRILACGGKIPLALD
jgi:hypothetical protein